jgi:hypothetical protein
MPRAHRRTALSSWLLGIVILVLGWTSIFFLQNSIEKTYRRRLAERLVEEMMYFPSGKFLKPVLIEYQDLGADLVWLRAIQYYGQHLMTDLKFEWLGHIFEILTRLDPHFVGAYHFGSMTMAWDAHEPNAAIDLLRTGTTNNPLNWQLPFDMGFIYYSLLNDYNDAGYYFQIASKLPDAWNVLPRWSAFAYERAGKNEVSRQIWTDIYNQTNNKAIKNLAERNLALIRVDEDISVLQAAVKKYRTDKGSNPPSLYELFKTGYVKYLPKDPWG